MAVRIEQGKALSVLNLTPLIDVVFLLLIFFLVASRLSQEEHQLDIALPSAANAQPMTAEPQELIVNIDQQGKILVDAKEMSLIEFEDLIRSLSLNNPNGNSVVIRADRRVQFQGPISVMDTCLKHGVPYSASIAEENSQ
jgi:biopolymer transport protein ExbD